MPSIQGRLLLALATLVALGGCQATRRARHLLQQRHDLRLGPHHRTLARSLLQSADTTAPADCTWTAGIDNYTVSTCTSNQDFLLYHTNVDSDINVNVNGDYVGIHVGINNTSASNNTAYAASAFSVAFSGAACATYNVSTEEGMQDCVADTSNHCFLGTDGPESKCYSAAKQVTTPGLYNCPGSASYARDVCIASNRTSCQANPDCVWSLLGWGFRQELLTPDLVQYYEERWQSLFNNSAYSGPYPVEYGWCQYAPEFEAATAQDNTTYSWDDKGAWADATVASTDLATFYEYNGNCTASQEAFSANAYSNLCDSFNHELWGNEEYYVDYALIRSDKPVNITAMQGCIESKCALNLYYTNYFVSIPAYAPYFNFTAAYICEADTGRLNSYFFNRSTDELVYDNQVTCNLFANQFDEQSCLGATGPSRK